MSDFTDFFPVSGGSGVGSGIPINGYFPFIVSSTGDTTGYDSTTGLYTHPDGTFWLKSGFQISNSTSVYPNATGGDVESLTQQADIPYSFATTTGITYDSINGTYWIQIQNGNTVEYTTAGVATGTSWNAGIVNIRNIAYDSTADTLWISSASKFVSEFTKAGVATGRTFSTGFIGELTYDPNNNTLWIVDTVGTSNIIKEYNLTTGATLTTLTLGTVAIQALYYKVSDNTFWAASSTGPVTLQYTKVGVATGKTLPTPANPNAMSGNQNDGITILDFNGPIIPYFPLFTVGDPTARTDTDTAQPLFVRIG